jgi:crotonobetainyl-CoA:carnitine CoA-transferase CaiB-like acyl-CoA transferase
VCLWRPWIYGTNDISPADLLAKLEGVGMPAGPINTLEQVFTAPLLAALGPLSAVT